MKDTCKLILISFLLFLLVSCENSEDFIFDESIHRGEAFTSSNERILFSTSFETFPNERSGLYQFRAHSFPSSIPNMPPISVKIRVADLQVGCKSLTYAPAIPIGGAIDYPHAIALIQDDDQTLGRYMLREDRENSVCINEVLRDGREISGTFELHMYRNPASLPSLETRWPDSLSLTEGTFRAFGRVGQ